MEKEREKKEKHKLNRRRGTAEKGGEGKYYDVNAEN